MRIAALTAFLLLTSLVQGASIWQVKGPQEFYLFGTVHLLKPDSFPLPDIYAKTLAQCDSLWLEIDSNELKDLNNLHAVQSLMQLPAGQNLLDTLTISQYRQLRVMADKAKVDISPLMTLKLWAVVNQLTTEMFTQRGFAQVGLDVYLHQYAEQHSLPIHAFETYLFQMQLFETLQNQSVDKYLAFSAEDLDNADVWIDDMIRSWQQGDYQPLYESSGFDQYPAIEQAMLTNRNDTWMKTLLHNDMTGTTCVAVGLLHMAGEHGLIQQFNAAGYQVTRLP